MSDAAAWSASHVFGAHGECTSMKTVFNQTPPLCVEFDCVCGGVVLGGTGSSSVLPQKAQTTSNRWVREPPPCRTVPQEQGKVQQQRLPATLVQVMRSLLVAWGHWSLKPVAAAKAVQTARRGEQEEELACPVCCKAGRPKQAAVLHCILSSRVRWTQRQRRVQEDLLDQQTPITTAQRTRS